MELIRGWHNLKNKHQGSVLTIGNFDGVHRGHQALLMKLLASSRKFQLPSVVISFEPQPHEYFSKGKKTSRLMRLRDKIQALDEIGVDRLLVGYFNQGFADISAEEFVSDYLVRRLGIKHIIVGDDFRFGAGRLGDVDLLRKLGLQWGFSVEEMSTTQAEGQRVSSTLIRQQLEAGHLSAAQQLLGHYYWLSGRVIHGDKLGRSLGFPTANINLDEVNIPLKGIFAVMVEGLGDLPLAGVASIGTRPTVGGTKRLLEVYLFEFDQAIYGRCLKVHFIAKHRDEIHFSSLEAMKKQIEEDSEWAQALLGRISLTDAPLRLSEAEL